MAAATGSGDDRGVFISSSTDAVVLCKCNNILGDARNFHTWCAAPRVLVLTAARNVMLTAYYYDVDQAAIAATATAASTAATAATSTGAPASVVKQEGSFTQGARSSVAGRLSAMLDLVGEAGVAKYADVLCTVCQSLVGRTYSVPPREHSDWAWAFVFDLDAITLYMLDDPENLNEKLLPSQSVPKL
eukprot:TRINITY_DN11725_c0_g1_i2.p1 TRINITY_DN11725_c0_g1~~TRINITY_DN11725_c0_g1_i2.p1  ORF type:complete len:199 (-),score=54.68 TRINITY_DN11725_c0_g1_i2:17-580(-)